MPARIAFITGASSGLGAGLATRLALEGYAVGLAARRLEALEEVASSIRARGGQAAVLPCDVGNRDAVHAALRACEERLGPVDLLICNAGISEMTEVEAFRASDLERVMRVNFFGAVYAVEAILPRMLERGSGHLVGIGSLAGYGGLPRTAAYSASKGALHNLFESLRVDLRGTGVSVTVVTPGYVRTPMTAVNLHAMPFLVERDDAVERIARAIRKRRRLVAFPRPLAALAWLAQVFPPVLYDWLASKQRREKRPPPDADTPSPSDPGAPQPEAVHDDAHAAERHGQRREDGVQKAE